MCFVIMELFTNLSPNETTEHFPIGRESLKTKTKNEKSIENKSKVYSEANI